MQAYTSAPLTFKILTASASDSETPHMLQRKELLQGFCIVQEAQVDMINW